MAAQRAGRGEPGFLENYFKSWMARLKWRFLRWIVSYGRRLRFLERPIAGLQSRAVGKRCLSTLVVGTYFILNEYLEIDLLARQAPSETDVVRKALDEMGMDITSVGTDRRRVAPEVSRTSRESSEAQGDLSDTEISEARALINHINDEAVRIKVLEQAGYSRVEIRRILQ